MNLNPQHLSLSFRFSWEETQLTCSSTHGILLVPSVASFGFHLSTKSAMVPQRPRQSLPRWFRPSPGIQGVDYAVMFFLCFHVFLLLKNLTSCFCFLEVVLLLFDVTKLFYIEVWQRTSLITHGKLFDACPGIEGQFDLEAAPEVAARLRRCS